MVVRGTITNLQRGQASISAGNPNAQTSSVLSHLPNSLIHVHILPDRIDFIDGQLQDSPLAFLRGGLLSRDVQRALGLDRGLLNLDQDLLVWVILGYPEGRFDWGRTFLSVSSDNVAMVDGKNGWIGPIISRSQIIFDVHRRPLSVIGLFTSVPSESLSLITSFFSAPQHSRRQGTDVLDPGINTSICPWWTSPGIPMHIVRLSLYCLHLMCNL